MEITYSLIKDTIVEEKIEGGKLYCTFKIEGEVFEETGFVKSDNKGAAKVTRMVKTTAIGRMRSVVLRVLRKAVGGGFAGTMVSMGGAEAIRQQTDGAQFSRADKEKATVGAFQKVLKGGEIFYDDENKRWRVSRELSAFEKKLKRDPLESPYDRKILARMLVEMARADGSIAAEEKEFFENFLTEETGSLGQLMRAPSVSVVECEEISEELQGTVFMIVAAVAITDHDFDESEKQKLMEYSEMFGFKDDKRDELMVMAQDYTVEAYVKAKGEMSRDDLYAFADRIGMKRDDAERAQIRLEKRLVD
ncbi:MAG: TerB family tellurite resistance protein [Aureispira sp.]|nr:TerB family tellurite resistance protein [Aureispira sp.]